MKTYFIKTYGCSMNIADSEKISYIMRQAKYQPARSLSTADIIILNTCAVRQKAEDKISGLGKTFLRHKTKPLIILTGCLARHHYQDPQKSIKYKKQLKERLPWIDYMLDIQNINYLPKILSGNSTPSPSNKKHYLETPSHFQSDVSAYIPIMTGCNEFCSYCIVPFSRGPEFSRPLNGILDDFKSGLRKGYKHFALLGQIVDKWHSRGLKFDDLLETILKLPQNFWLFFLSPHPKYITKNTLDLIGQHPKMLRYLNLPLQSGSDKILQTMNRKYTVQEYRSVASYVRTSYPKVFLSTDIIVGFPGETDSDFESTYQMVKELKFNKVFLAKFSPRLDTVASKLPKQVSDKVKKQRFKKLKQLCDSLFSQHNQQLEGTVQKTLITSPKTLINEQNQLVELEKELKGKPKSAWTQVHIIQGDQYGLKGKIIN